MNTAVRAHREVWRFKGKGKSQSRKRVGWAKSWTRKEDGRIASSGSRSVTGKKSFGVSGSANYE